MQFELFFPCLYNHPSATSSTFPAACVSVHFLYSCPPLPLSLPLFLSLSLSSSSPTVVDGLLTVLCSGRRLLLSVQPFLGPIGSRCVAGTQRQQPFMERENVCVCMWDNLWQRCDISSSQCALDLFLTRVHMCLAAWDVYFSAHVTAPDALRHYFLKDGHTWDTHQNVCEHTKNVQQSWNWTCG